MPAQEARSTMGVRLATAWSSSRARRGGTYTESYYIRLLPGDTAVVTGLAKFHVNASGNDIKFQTRFTDVYAKRNGVWQMVAWQSTKIPD